MALASLELVTACIVNIQTQCTCCHICIRPPLKITYTVNIPLYVIIVTQIAVPQTSIRDII
jgi:hypothetical protein